jgi:DNA invertase Pin-like site-specific DNA recombinase|tara:strand:+ start:5426 stop:5623 length:198 start_codon:yes stop_codon:yes gene_type:complete
MNKIILSYCRVSTSEQSTEGAGLDNQKQPAVYKMVPPNKFKFVKANEGEQDRFTLVTTILNELLP